MALPDRPLSRKEEYLAAIAGEEGVKPDRPLSRTEEYLEAIDEYLDTKANLVDGKVPASELPSYVDDVIEGYYYNSKFYEDEQHTDEIAPESSKIYVDLPTGDTYRWGGTVYVKIGGGGGGGGDATADLTLVAVASGITTSGSYNTQAITDFTSFTLTANKDFDTLLAKARTKRLSIDGGVSWIVDGVTTIADVNVHEQSVYPKEALSQLGIATNKDAILLLLSSIYERGDQTDRELELYLRFTPAMRLIYEDTNGTMQIIDPSQGS